MAIDIIPKAQFPNVPQVPGVPALPRSGVLPPVGQAVVGAIEGVLWQTFSRQVVWGIYTGTGASQQSLTDQLLANAPRIGVPGYTFNPKPVVPGLIAQADTVVDFGYHNESNISAFPVQRGSFANYNKVNNPYDVRVRLFKGGNVTDRQVFLSAIEAASKSLDLYSVVTPERTYLNANIVGYELVRRADEGSFSLAVDITLIEIREIIPTYSATAAASQPSGLPAVDQGLTQGVDPVATVKTKTQSLLRQVRELIR